MEILLTAGGKFCLPDAGKTDYRALGKLLTVERKKSLPHCGKNTLPSTRELDARRSEMPHDRCIRKLVGYGEAGERLPRRGPVRRRLLPPLGAGLRRRPRRREHESWQGQRAPARPRP